MIKKHFSMRREQITNWMLLGAFILSFWNVGGAIGQTQNLIGEAGARKIKDIVIYENSLYYSSFPSVIKGKKGEFLLAFRRAPDRKVFKESGTNYVDPNSYLMLIRSKDGETWSQEPELLYAHSFGGSQDPCLLSLRDGTLLCTSYGWAFVRPEGLQNLKSPFLTADDRAIFLGGYLLRSSDNGKTWKGPIYPPHLSTEIYINAMGSPLPAYNRGALVEDRNGRIYWVVAVNDCNAPRKTSTHLLVSEDNGKSWHYSCPVATDKNATFSETSLYITSKGDLIAFMRTADLDDEACIARSTDGGKSFQPWEKMGFQGHPLQALRLSDNKVLLVYGYRHEPYGIRARILNPECTDFRTTPEIILREDGGNADIGYPWSVQLDKNRILIVYYFNKDGGTRHIAGTIIEIMH
jgi:hypothetical protein